MSWKATQDRQVIVKSSDKMWSTVGGNRNPLQDYCLENSINSMKMQKDKTLDDELPGWKACIMLLGKRESQLLIIQKERSSWVKAEMMLSYG